MLTRALFLPSRHPWSHVVIGMWHKYPNPHCSHVVTLDVLDRSVDPRTGIIRTERMLGCKQKAPMWIVKVRRMRTRSAPQLLIFFCVPSSSVVQKMPSYERCPLSILRRRTLPSPRSTSPYPNSRPATRAYDTHRHRTARRRSCKLRRSKRG